LSNTTEELVGTVLDSIEPVVDTNLSNYSDYYAEWDSSDEIECPSCYGTGLDRDEMYDCQECYGEGYIIYLSPALDTLPPA
jgi:DnaJ-class molecular chaperone